jgi:hypothetical protein
LRIFFAGIAGVLGIDGALVILKMSYSVAGIRCEPEEEREGLA